MLNAGATIGAVRESRRQGEYLVRAELYEFLCEVIKKQLKNRPDETRRGLELNELEKRMTEALIPHVKETVEAVLQQLHPIDEKNGFTSEIFMSEVPQEHVRPVRNVLTAGSSLRVVQRDRTDRDRYYLHGELYKTLARIRARAHAMDRRALPIDGGVMRPHQAAIADQRAERLLANGQANGQARESDEDLRAEFRQLLIEAIELPAAAWDKVASPEIAAQALSAAAALKRQARAHQGLNEELKLVESDKLANLDRERNVLAARVESDRHAFDLLQDTATEVAQRVPALILLPEGGLIDRLVAALEEGHAENRLRDDEHVLLSRLRRLKAELDRMDWSDAGAWRKVVRDIDHLNDAGISTLAAAAINPKFN
jgi:hypothetical protein